MYWAPPLPPTLVTWRVTVGHLPHQYGDLLQTYRGLSAVINMTCLSSPVILFIVHVSRIYIRLHWPGQQRNQLFVNGVSRESCRSKWYFNKLRVFVGLSATRCSVLTSYMTGWFIPVLLDIFYRIEKMIVTWKWWGLGGWTAGDQLSSNLAGFQ